MSATRRSATIGPGRPLSSSTSPLPTVPAPLELKRSGRLTHPLLRGVTLGLRFEYVHDGEVVGRGVAWAADDLERFQYSHVVIQPVGDRRDARGRHALALVTEQPERFTLRVTGDGEMALRHIQGTRYWAGAFERPLRGGPDRPRRAQRLISARHGAPAGSDSFSITWSSEKLAAS